jgi:hypothetical protein
MKKKYINVMFVDYDRCHDYKTDTDKLCRNCTPKQQAKCQKKNQ